MNKLKSRKLWVAVLGAALMSLAHELGIPEEHAQYAVGLLAAYVLSEGAADVMSRKYDGL